MNHRTIASAAGSAAMFVAGLATPAAFPDAPPWIGQIGLGLSALLAILSMLFVILAKRKDKVLTRGGWLERSQTTLVSPPPPGSILALLAKEKASADFFGGAPPFARWVPLNAALKYVAFQSDWAFSLQLQTWQDGEAVLKREILEALASSEVLARGRVEVCKSPSKLSAASVDIPADFWPYAYIQPFGEIFQDDPERCVATTDGNFYQITKQFFREITLNRDQMLSRWPPATAEKAERHSSPFERGVSEYGRASDKDANFEFELEAELLMASHAKTDC